MQDHPICFLHDWEVNTDVVDMDIPLWWGTDGTGIRQIHGNKKVVPHSMCAVEDNCRTENGCPLPKEQAPPSSPPTYNAPLWH